jgi:hypothetical protein
LCRVELPPYCCEGLHTQLPQLTRVLKGGHLTTKELQQQKQQAAAYESSSTHSGS